MTMVLKVLIICLVYLHLAFGQETECQKESKDFDKLITNYFLLAAPTRKYPTNQGELKRFCKDNPVLSSKVKKYANKCMDKLLKRLTSLAIYSIQKTNANMCRSRRRSAELIEMGKCGNAVNKDNRKCWDNWIKGSNSIGSVTDNKLRIPLICCITYTMKTCFAQNYEKNRSCSKNAKDGLDNLIGSYLTDTLALMCGEYTEDNDKCDQIITKMPKPKTKNFNNSPVSIMFAIFDGIPEDTV